MIPNNYETMSEGTMKKHIKEIIVVEGKDDVSAVRRAVDATILTTSGMGLAHLDEIRTLAARQGAIILTDPDVPGTRIRQRVTELVPDAKQAFIDRKDARHPHTGKIGVEYAAPEAIVRALDAAYATTDAPKERYTMSDLMHWGLAGAADSGARRARFCETLHLGHANAKTLLKRLNAFAVDEETIAEALETMEAEA